MKTIITLLPLLCCFSLLAQVTPEFARKKYFTKPTALEIELDGIPDEEAWKQVDWGGDFIVFQPNEGEPPSQQTNFKILYDDKFLYLGFRCYDSAPDSIIRRMGRRDEFPGDWVEINIDSYHDLRTAFSFTMSVSGVKNDEFVSDNGNYWDPSWNPIWYLETHRDSLGWTAEAKIPFSQLRYGTQDDPVWGIQVMRRLFRKEERSTWQFIPQNSGVWVSSFGELHGLRNVPPQRQVEIQPYVVAQAETFEKEEGNPFADGSDARISGGLDGKVAVTSDLILDFTINPDFGQVEADPSAVRLDGYRIFFEERRPFFIESRNIFDYRVAGSEAGGDYDADLLFYSRRIGGAPHGYPLLADGEHTDLPDNTSILGAAKFSGKTKDGWSVGILESITQREYAQIDNNGERREEVVEPLSNYFVGRLQKDLKEGNTVIGGMITAVNREATTKSGIGFLHRSAYTGGLDFQQFWKKRTWFFKAKGIFSRVEGSEEAILATQTSFEHLFQRPDADHLKVDSTRTSLTGHGGTLKIGKIGGEADSLGGVFKFESGVTWRSPELELNDIGFLLAADEINHFTWAGYRISTPFSIFRNWMINYNHWSRWDFGGQFLYQAFNTNTHATFKNNWQFGTGVTWNPLEVSNNALRGASSLRKPPGMGHFFYLNSDSRKKIVPFIEVFHAWGFGNTVRVGDYSGGIRFQPLNNLNFSLQPAYSRFWRRQDQFVENVDFNGKTRTIVSQVEQRTFRFVMRLNYNVTPDLTIQYYGQPFISRALYKNFGLVTDPMNRKYDERFHRFSGQEISFASDEYFIDENLDGQADYSFVQPDFNFVQFFSNLVVRWEYIPGSEVYLVWSQANTPDAFNDLQTPLFDSLLDHAFEKKAHNIFLVKFTYRFLL